MENQLVTQQTLLSNQDKFDQILANQDKILAK